MLGASSDSEERLFYGRDWLHRPDAWDTWTTFWLALAAFLVLSCLIAGVTRSAAGVGVFPLLYGVHLIVWHRRWDQIQDRLFDPTSKWVWTTGLPLPTRLLGTLFSLIGLVVIVLLAT